MRERRRWRLILLHRLTARGIAVHVLLRGYGGAARGPRRVQPDDTAAITGDEALLLAAVAPTWTGADRAASAQAAVAAGAEVLLMDDGLQNPSLEKTVSLLVVDGAAGFGNGRVAARWTVAGTGCRGGGTVPGCGVDRSGCQRRSGCAAARTAGAARGTGAGRRDRRSFVGAECWRLPASRSRRNSLLAWNGRVSLSRAAWRSRITMPLRNAELAGLVRKAREVDAVLVTTPKDAVRLPAGADVCVVGVHLVWEAMAAVESLLDSLVAVGSK